MVKCLDVVLAGMRGVAATIDMTALTVDEAADLAKSVRAVCDRLATEEQIRVAAFDRGGYDAELWRVLCAQVGVAAIALPDELGGGGLGATALGVVAHELGRALAPVPFLASAVLATGLMTDAGPAPRIADKLQAYADGERTAAAVVTGDGGLWQRSAVSVSAESTDGGWTLTGSARHVLHGSAADDLVVIASVRGEPAVFVVDAAADGVTVAAERVLDGTRPMATIEFAGAAAERLSGDGPADDVIAHNVQRAMAVLSAEQVGAHERVLEIACDYARTRQQFGRPIGSFQAIKHRCADMLVELEWARSASAAALQSLDEADGDIAWRASMATAVCSEALRNATASNIQIHGGIGFTWEDAAHLYFKRARTDEVLFGGPGPHWDRLAGHAGRDGSQSAGPAADSVEPMRADIRAFLADAPKPDGLRNYGPTPTATDVEPGRAWHRYLLEHGWACLNWPVEHGGADAPVLLQAVFAEECARAGVPRQFHITGVDLVGPVLIKYGTQAQKSRYLEPIRRSDEIWSQLFSEPGAGSDLAGVRTRAEQTASGWRVNGQKVWSSAAKYADFGLLLARTGDHPHRGLTMFVVDMRSPGVQVRPLRQIDGESKFNEVFLDDVELPADAVVGEAGHGWEVAMLMLGRERLTLGSQAVGMFLMHERMVAAARERGVLDQALARSMTKLWARMWLLRFTWERAIAAGDTASSAFSVLKLMTSETDRDLGDMATEVLGTDVCLDPTDSGGRDVDLVRAMLVGRAQTILGGTSEIQRNILGERVLGLPREPR